MTPERTAEWDKLFMKFAADVAGMSRAVRLKVGAVAVRDLRVIAIGYNGTAKGEDNCCEDMFEFTPTEDTSYGGEIIEWRNNKNWILRTKPDVVHAEDNLIKYAKEHNIDLNGCTLYITHSPCPSCGTKIIDAGFKEVVFDKHYRIISDLSILTDLAGILVRQWKA